MQSKHIINYRIFKAIIEYITSDLKHELGDRCQIEDTYNSTYRIGIVINIGIDLAISIYYFTATSILTMTDHQEITAAFALSEPDSITMAKNMINEIRRQHRW